MTRIVNSAQAESWSGPEGAHWARQPERIEAMHSVLDEPLLTAAGIRVGDRVLDIGCGNGGTTRRAARAVTDGLGGSDGGTVVGIDLSGPMLDQARTLAASDGLTNITFEYGDAQVHPFTAESFDVAISRFGIMFFADPVAAFGNIRRALRRGGRLAFVCPQPARRNAWYRVPQMALHGTENGPLPESGMFSLAEPGRVTEVLTAAGFVDIRPEPVAAPMTYGVDVAGAVEFVIGTGPVRALLEQGSLTVARARQRLTAGLRPYLGPDGVALPGAYWLVTATRPEGDR
ncbi:MULTISPECIES: class I SAM-dependent methyltransferase [unclassified Solwaraspora]|uniref:class I SAM-dependent methyltransferase n=1 Tax=unclassified Solwaraspora TaxID=2627926 RepID=UPI00259BC2B7|nr:class I SAM-dependent methyltransferase [Solwaraspora sp. WMMA2056]WJK43178.1 class I SAM-dependent methyltransferase [Solwaraspora sp. WMMA2056]